MDKLEKKRASDRKYGAENRESIKIKTKNKLIENPDLHKDYHLKSRYGVTKETYDNMLIDQNESCEICKKHKSNFKRNLHVDHNHSTNEVRGLLCPNCNHILGNSFENKDILLKVIEYLDKYNTK